MVRTGGWRLIRLAICVIAAAVLSIPASAFGDRVVGATAWTPALSSLPADLAVPHRSIQAVPARPPAKPKPQPAMLVRIPSSRPITSRPGGGRTVGLMPSSSKYLHQPTVSWVMETTPNGRYGKVTLPFSGRGSATGWMALKGLSRSRTPYSVLVDLSKHRVSVLRMGRVLFSVAAATGAPVSPTPTGRYFVTDRVSVYVGSAFGSFAFGISALQTHLPPGWGGGNQVAIHGTNSPSSIGTSASAGCVRVSEASLARLKPLLQLGTPVVIQA